MNLSFYKYGSFFIEFLILFELALIKDLNKNKIQINYHVFESIIPNIVILLRYLCERVLKYMTIFFPDFGCFFVLWSLFMGQFILFS